jgi:16S rRNA (cytosine1402-N4)-methyltransferase
MTEREGGHATVHHITVLLAEAVESLAVRPAGTYVDGTFGRGGHSRKILDSLGPDGRLIALDRDAAAVAAAASLRDPRFEIVRAHFSSLSSVLEARGIARVDGVLLDLGVSSPQLGEPARGFSFRLEGPLDMRMDEDHGEPASVWLARADQEEIARVIRDYGEERFARQIARAIVEARSKGPIETTRQLAVIVASAVRTREPGQDPATRTFQALRIFVNRELEEVEAVLPQALNALKPSGRLVVISFHSLEDRLVKHFMRDHSRPPEVPRGIAVRESERPVPQLRLVGSPVRPSAAEVAANPRSRSAVMRVAERTAA